MGQECSDWYVQPRPILGPSSQEGLMSHTIPYSRTDAMPKETDFEERGLRVTLDMRSDERGAILALPNDRRSAGIRVRDVFVVTVAIFVFVLSCCVGQQ
mmetsp:Transcript_25285/g.39167  ORF Transcript_25285/g.39167 Transcript_25285/m.39167 type:complete len:99 (-) Transcript_25285:2-298(-)